MKKIRILMADDHVAVRDSVSMLLDSEDNIEVVGLAADGEEAVEKSHDLLPDIVLMDIDMPIMRGFKATEKIEPCPI